MKTKPYFSNLVQMLPKEGKFLEIGAGDGQFMCYAHLNTKWDVHGYDINEHAGSSNKRINLVGENLKRHDIPENRYQWIALNETLPYEDNYFDFTISIQTLEHVKDLQFLFSEIARVLKPGGKALHFFPTRDIFVDPHSGIPFAHSNSNRRRKLLSSLSRIGFGKFKKYKANRGILLEEFVDEFDTYIEQFCHFRSRQSILEQSESNGLQSFFRPIHPIPKNRILTATLSRFTSICLVQTLT